jgi:nitrate reductase gamma subunit
MSGAVLLHLIVYGSLATFVGVVGYRFIKIYRMPMHLRWELYPVAHEPGDKAKYGGSRLEELDWWTKPKETSTANELKYMIPEMTLLVALFEHNRKMWWRSFPFHFGLYILAGLIGLLGFGAILELFGVPVSNHSIHIIGTPVFYLTKAAALGGLGLGLLGALGLLHLRLFDEDLRDFTSMGHLFNLVAFIGVLSLAWLTFIFADTDFVATRNFIQSLITFNLTAPLGGDAMNSAEAALLGAEIALAVLLMAYIPMTHMSHFFIKWFTYHSIRWEDEENEVGSEIEKKVIEQVGYPVTWAAPHLKADGKKNWVDIATEEME